MTKFLPPCNGSSNYYSFDIGNPIPFGFDLCQECQDHTPETEKAEKNPDGAGKGEPEDSSNLERVDSGSFNLSDRIWKGGTGGFIGGVLLEKDVKEFIKKSENIILSDLSSISKFEEFQKLVGKDLI